MARSFDGLCLSVILGACLAAMPRISRADAHDAVVEAISPVTLKFPAKDFVAVTTVPVTVRNLEVGNGPQQTVQVQVTPEGCGDVILHVIPSTLNFTAAGEEQTTTLVFIADRAHVDSFNGKNPMRCRYDLSAVTTVPAASVDPTPSNNTEVFELNLVDASDGPASAPYEFFLDSIAPVTKLKRGGATKSTMRKLSNAGTTSQTIALAVTPLDGACNSIVGVTSAQSGPVTVASGKTNSEGIKVVGLTAAAPTGSALSPTRCMFEVTATGGSGADGDPANDVARFSVDVIP